MDSEGRDFRVFVQIPRRVLWSGSIFAALSLAGIRGFGSYSFAAIVVVSALIHLVGTLKSCERLTLPLVGFQYLLVVCSLAGVIFHLLAILDPVAGFDIYLRNVLTAWTDGTAYFPFSVYLGVVLTIALGISASVGYLGVGKNRTHWQLATLGLFTMSTLLFSCEFALLRPSLHVGVYDLSKAAPASFAGGLGVLEYPIAFHILVLLFLCLSRMAGSFFAGSQGAPGAR